MLHPKMKHIYVGVDIHRQTHTAVIIDCFGDKMGEITFQNKPSHFKKLLSEVNKNLSKGVTAVYGLEDVGGSGRMLAIYLSGKKHTIKHVNPSLTQMERKTQSVYHKTDSFDALCIARILLARFGQLPDAYPQDNYLMLSQLVARRSSIVKSITALNNQLQNLIIQHYPGYRKFFYIFDAKCAMAFWEKYPSPLKLIDVTVTQLGNFLYENSSRFFGEKKATEILNLVKMDGNTITEYQETRDFIISTSIRQLKNIKNELAEVEEHIKKLVPQFGFKLSSMGGISYITEAELIAHIGDINRFSSSAKLAKYSGISPVSYSSGKTDKLLCNALGDRKLNSIFFSIAIKVAHNAGDSKKAVNTIFYQYYRKKISEGKTKKQALKCVMRRLVNIIYSMMKNKSEYRQPSNTDQT